MSSFPAFASPQTTRFAPSPTGQLHLGHAYAAFAACAIAQHSGGTFFLRIDDIDFGRCRPEYETQLYTDLKWLGLTWQEPVLRQSDRIKAYEYALGSLAERGLTYPCFCTRNEIQAEIKLMASAPHRNPMNDLDGPAYPGTCRDLSQEEVASKINAAAPHAVRLNAEVARAQLPELTFIAVGDDPREIAVDLDALSDVVLARKGIGTSYHLATVIDDDHQNITLVTRGEDLLPATHIQRILQYLLDLKAPKYFHHRLITDEMGRRLAKRDNARAIKNLREMGATPDTIKEQLGLV